MNFFEPFLITPTGIISVIWKIKKSQSFVKELNYYSCQIYAETIASFINSSNFKEIFRRNTLGEKISTVLFVLDFS